MQQKEDVLYITLIDFLLQLLFLGMVISVVYAVAQQMAEDAAPDPIQAKNAIENMEKVKQLTGISDLTELTDELTRLGPLNQAKKNSDSWKEISKEVSAIGGMDVAKKTLAEQAIKKAGEGLPSCMPNKSRLATFHAYIDRIELGEYNETELSMVLDKLGLSKEGIQSLPLKDFTRKFNPINTTFPDCRYSINLIEHTYDTRPRDAVRIAFGRTFPKHAADIN